MLPELWVKVWRSPVNDHGRHLWLSRCGSGKLDWSLIKSHWCPVLPKKVLKRAVDWCSMQATMGGCWHMTSLELNHSWGFQGLLSETPQGTPSHRSHRGVVLISHRCSHLMCFCLGACFGLDTCSHSVFSFACVFSG